MPTIRRPEIMKREAKHCSSLRRILKRRRGRFEFSEPSEQRSLKRFPRIRPTPFRVAAIQPILEFHIRFAAGEIQIAQNVLEPTGQRGTWDILRDVVCGSVGQTLRFWRRYCGGISCWLTSRHKRCDSQQAQKTLKAAVSQPAVWLGRINFEVCDLPNNSWIIRPGELHAST